MVVWQARSFERENHNDRRAAVPSVARRDYSSLEF
jgi:hypothetical protein